VKVKTSATLASELFDRLARLESEERDRRDIDIIDRNADRLIGRLSMP
jgi:hypothetical protein